MRLLAGGQVGCRVACGRCVTTSHAVTALQPAHLLPPPPRRRLQAGQARSPGVGVLRLGTFLAAALGVPALPAAGLLLGRHLPPAECLPGCRWVAGLGRRMSTGDSRVPERLHPQKLLLRHHPLQSQWRAPTSRSCSHQRHLIRSGSGGQQARSYRPGPVGGTAAEQGNQGKLAAMLPATVCMYAIRSAVLKTPTDILPVPLFCMQRGSSYHDLDELLLCLLRISRWARTPGKGSPVWRTACLQHGEGELALALHAMWSCGICCHFLMACACRQAASWLWAAAQPSWSARCRRRSARLRRTLGAWQSPL